MLALQEKLNHKLQKRNWILEKYKGEGKSGKLPSSLREKLKRLESVSGASVLDQKSAASKKTKFKTFNFEKKVRSRYSMPKCHFDSFNLWLLKPTHLNRGRGIHVFNDMDTLIKLIKQYCSGKEEVNAKKKTALIRETEESKKNGDQVDHLAPNLGSQFLDSEGEQE